MDSGIRRLWTRRKSKGADGMLDSSPRNLKKSQSQSTDQTGGWSINGSPRSPYARPGSSMDKINGQLTPKSTPTSPRRPTSSSKRLPVLVSVSRPSTSASRPETSENGSLMKAVSRAATDAVARAEQEYRQSAEYYTRNNRRQKAPRYIDIFSISNANGKGPTTGYNEDIAERNLDLARVALEGNTQLLSSTASKYAEEVAARNAFPPLPSSSSLETPIASPRQDFDDMHTGISDYTSSSRMSDQSPVSESVEAPGKHIPNSIDAYSRLPNGQTWDAQPRSHRSLTDTRAHGTGRGSSAQNSQREGIASKDMSEGTLAVRSPGPSSRQQERDDVLRKYQLSPTEIMPNRYTDHPQPSRPIMSMSGNRTNVTHRIDYSVRSPSSLSNASSVRRAVNLPHRLIMDLTGNDSDVFSEASAASTYSSSPVVEQAKFDTMRRMQGAIMTSPRSEIDTDAPRTDPLLAEQVSPSAETEPSQPRTQDVPRSSVPQSSNTPLTSAFSPVSTVASLPPRASVYLESPVKSVAAGTRNLVVSAGPQTTEETAQHVQSEQQFSNDSYYEEEKEAVIQQEPRSTVSTPKPASQRTAVRDVSMAEQKPTHNNPAEMGHADGPSVQARDEPRQPRVHTVPDNLHSTAIVDPSQVFGVTARDFASTTTITPITSATKNTSLNSEGRPRSAKSTRNRSATHDPNTGRSSVKSPKPSLYQSTFDESGFAQKQAEARAALIRLQESLNENFLPNPSPAPLVQSSRTNTPKHNFSFSDGKPVAPSTIFAQVRNSPPVSPPPEDTTKEVRSDTTYHSLTTMSDTENMPNGITPKVSVLNTEGRGRSKGAELDGPGPSIMYPEALNKPLPMPPPLHVNGIRFTKQHQPVPPSPGEVSLSSFPIPVSSPRQSQASSAQASSSRQRANSADPQSSQSGTSQSQSKSHHSHQSSSGGTGRGLRRQSSLRSQASSASAFSIPYHMIPDRSSSIRDRSVMEESE
ncbi:hypothetical protein LTR10_018623 [Elasticomyces elasticus]|uniref:Uncharacterized protein n=1 Tax=Exophiala sideris TaxID=1016849 RepID=A0ABR0IZZ6_9EURO|nr:hypothetical protein LTR10_018623 [Elasticomyces elasticus]KAK5023262.1 hypothetical protein LTS07_009485 [Exophiala sideris]KAK5028634.1 hypothetical protein LTR13_009086 [Exophiala sideris]KAK5053012.1 hypothetical protein LTR69_009582 [Exophiala sideris]KAK5178752.1 hypothetical protein LTR44_008867 [Eurotiomycetes sp. CCFEE 6388]